ncbi:hypothetical protein ALC56_00607 [Trachymyrmex septentrionalis]|uniref:Uncharacterized protein n=1 Tax=Trachymyrmex septentrionalis TaxID=34720 RepID=A0A195FWB3_9HYME|nr:hypothetical protein ALC56_00607 [Trachymyrmex septentrionalis]
MKINIQYKHSDFVTCSQNICNVREKKSLPHLSRQEILRMRNLVGNKCTLFRAISSLVLCLTYILLNVTETMTFVQKLFSKYTHNKKRFHKKFCNETAKKICQKYKLDSCRKSILLNIFYSLRDETSREYSKLYGRKRVRSFVHHFLAFRNRHAIHACDDICLLSKMQYNSSFILELLEMNKESEVSFAFHLCDVVPNRMDDRSRCCSVKQQQRRDQLSTDSFTSVLLESKPHQNHHPYFSTSPGLS